MFSEEMLLDASEIAQCSSWVMVDARRLWTNVNLLTRLSARSLLELPWQVVASTVQLQVLVPLKPFVADFADESVSGH